MKEWFYRKPKPAIVSRQPAAPSIVVACEQCGFDYSIMRIEIDGKTGFVWTCECGSEFLPPGGSESFNLLRP